MSIFPRWFAPACLSLFLIPTLAAACSETDFSDMGGTLSGTNAGLKLSNSEIIAISGMHGLPAATGDLGTLSFSTGALSSGSLQMGGTFASGGSFTIDGNGTARVPDGAIFSGSFTGPVTWTLTTLGNGTHDYILTGVVTGMMGGVRETGVTVQLTVNTGKGYFGGSTQISSGDTALVPSSTPEPSTLALFGTGILGLGGLVRRKARRG